MFSSPYSTGDASHRIGLFASRAHHMLRSVGRGEGSMRDDLDLIERTDPAPTVPPELESVRDGDASLRTIVRYAAKRKNCWRRVASIGSPLTLSLPEKYSSMPACGSAIMRLKSE